MALLFGFGNLIYGMLSSLPLPPTRGNIPIPSHELICRAQSWSSSSTLLPSSPKIAFWPEVCFAVPYGHVILLHSDLGLGGGEQWAGAAMQGKPDSGSQIPR